MIYDRVTPAESAIADELFKPIYGAALVALFFAVAEDTFSRRQRLVVFGLLVIAGTVYLVNKRRREGS